MQKMKRHTTQPHCNKVATHVQSQVARIQVRWQTPHQMTLCTETQAKRAKPQRDVRCVLHRTRKHQQRNEANTGTARPTRNEMKILESTYRSELRVVGWSACGGGTGCGTAVNHPRGTPRLSWTLHNRQRSKNPVQRCARICHLGERPHCLPACFSVAALNRRQRNRRKREHMQ